MASPRKVRTPAHPRRRGAHSGGAVPGTTPLRSCTLTWYDPALGGKNSSHGQKDPHAHTASGEPYDAAKYTCAASAKYPFGTLLEIHRNGKAVTVKVNDRGGAVQGDHFDLSRAPAQDLGVISAGRTSGQFRIASGGATVGQVLGGAAPATNTSNQAAINSATDAVGGVTHAIEGPMVAIAAFFKMMMSLWYPSTWVRIGKAVIGFFLIMWGVHTLLKSQGIDVVKGAKSTAIKAAEVATVVK